LFIYLFEIVSTYVVQAGLKHMTILLPLPPHCIFWSLSRVISGPEKSQCMCVPVMQMCKFPDMHTRVYFPPRILQCLWPEILQLPLPSVWSLPSRGSWLAHHYVLSTREYTWQVTGVIKCLFNEWMNECWCWQDI
jgi:hypothetical protein